MNLRMTVCKELIFLSKTRVLDFDINRTVSSLHENVAVLSVEFRLQINSIKPAKSG